ncbi:lyase family protein [Geomicrobium sp. JCM 19037]|uniref:lyase family protein n=1 Tax=Geomicrobium sp. JCM 19037 TaxID=1460634 RepID=UPI002101126C|nr:lyase family protein [Geomicrobium sp. JCM 19037]
MTWHVQRDGLAEFSSIIAMISGTIGKIANEIINLQKSEIGEIEEGFKMGQVGSSTMPHKRNPMICEYVVGLTRLVQRNASLSLMHDPRTRARHDVLDDGMVVYSTDLHVDEWWH